MRRSLNKALSGLVMPLILSLKHCHLRIWGLDNTDEGLIEVFVSIAGEHKCFGGCLQDSRNKPKEDLSACPSSPMSSFSTFSVCAPSMSYARKGKCPMD